MRLCENEITQSFGKQLTWCVKYYKHSNVHCVIVNTTEPCLCGLLVASGSDLTQVSSNKKGRLLAHRSESLHTVGLLFSMVVSSTSLKGVGTQPLSRS